MKKVNFSSLLLFLYSDVVTRVGKKLCAEMSEGKNMLRCVKGDLRFCRGTLEDVCRRFSFWQHPLT